MDRHDKITRFDTHEVSPRVGQALGFLVSRPELLVLIVVFSGKVATGSTILDAAISVIPMLGLFLLISRIGRRSAKHADD